MRTDQQKIDAFCRKVARLGLNIFATDSNEKPEWITMNGTHIHVGEGETPKEAGKRFIKSKEQSGQTGQTGQKPKRKGLTQEFTSEKTSRKQIASVLKKAPFKQGTRNIDIGGGKYDFGTDYLKTKGVENHVYDPYNRTAEHNLKALSRLKNGEKFDTATIANVLNVIKEPEVRENVVKQAARSIKDDGTAYFQFYEKSQDGHGHETSDGYQTSMKTRSYMPLIEKYFEYAKPSGNVIIAKKPKKVDGIEWRLSKTEIYEDM